ncbi:MAG: DUF4912 domain-containing protein, partial [Pirellulaceae bacterium]
NAKSVKELRSVAARMKIDGSGSLGKDSLVKAIVRASQAKGNAVKSNPGKGGGKSREDKLRSGKDKDAKASGIQKLAPKISSRLPPKAATGKPGTKASDKAKVVVVKPSEAKPAKDQPGHPVNGRKDPGLAEKAVKGKASPGKSGKDKEGLDKAKETAKSPRVTARIQMAHALRDREKNLATEAQASAEVKVVSFNGHGHGNAAREIHKSSVKKDRILLLVRDAYWIQAVWELTRQSVDRAQVALAQQWHAAKPVLRLIQLESNNTTSAVEQVARIIPIHGGVNTWFLDVSNSPKTFRVDIGYLTATGKFFSLARSNSVTTPRPGSGDGLENNWSDIANDCEKIYALSGGFSDEMATNELQEAFEERLGRPMGGAAGSRYGVGADKVFSRRSEFQFDVDAEMIIFGRARTNARVTLAGNPVKLRPDGTFAARLAMPDRRQVLPIVASSADGVEQRTVVIAVERNTKVMEPMLREAND